MSSSYASDTICPTAKTFFSGFKHKSWLCKLLPAFALIGEGMNCGGSPSGAAEEGEYSMCSRGRNSKCRLAELSQDEEFELIVVLKGQVGHQAFYSWAVRVSEGFRVR